MRAHDELLLARHLFCPAFDVALRDLGYLPAGFAEQMMMMLGRAQSVASLGGILPDHVHRAFIREPPQGPVHGSETRAAAARAQTVVQLLGGERFPAAKHVEN